MWLVSSYHHKRAEVLNSVVEEPAIGTGELREASPGTWAGGTPGAVPVHQPCPLPSGPGARTAACPPHGGTRA